MDPRILYMPRGARRKRSTRGKLLLLAVFFFLSAVIGGVIYALRYPDWQIREISLSGFQRVDPSRAEEILARELSGNFAAILPRRSYFLFSSDRAEEVVLREIPQIGSVEIRKAFPSTIVLAARERDFWAIFCARSGECGFLDETGFLYESAPVSSGFLLLKISSDDESLRIPSQPISAELAGTLSRFAAFLEEKTGEEAVEFFLQRSLGDEFRVRVRRGFLLYVLRDDDHARVIEILKTFLEKEIGERRNALEYVDLRFGNKIFYRSR